MPAAGLENTMTLQNRVTPFGEIVADQSRGTIFGNRGGRFHDPKTKTLSKRRWASRQWIICVLEFKGRQRDVMGNSYTELFFLDEVTALAAGHRPCFECRRAAANSYFAAYRAFHATFTQLPPMRQRLKASQMDTLLHHERVLDRASRRPIELHESPDGAMFEHDGSAWALRDGQLLHWTPSGYDRAIPAKGMANLMPLTPTTTLCILQHGYEPEWHSSANTF